MRSIIAGLTVEQILRDRAEFNKKVLEESADEFRKLGIQIITLVVQDVKDTLGYIQALGQQEVAEKKRDAAIKTAEADKETKIKVSDAQREAAQVAAQNAAKVADAEKDRDIQIAEFKVQTETKKAEADMANSIAKTTQEKNLRVLEADRDTAAAQAGISVQEQRAKLKERELNATLIVEANAKRDAAIIDADALQQVATRTAKRVEIEADGNRAAAIKEGEGIASRTKSIAVADADATRVKLTAEADGAKAAQLAIAAGSEANLLAAAKGTEAELLAKAKGTLELAEAMKSLDERGQLLLVLDKLPGLFDKGGDAGAKMLAAVFTPLGTSLGAIKQVSIVDMGGTDSKGGVAKFAGSIPSMLAEMLVKAEAKGIDIKPLLKLAKIDTGKLQQMIGLVDSVLPAETTKVE
jgi:flotillin